MTVFDDDDQAYDIWRKAALVPPERIQRRGMDDNYWSMGVPGPCGPCSEILRPGRGTTGRKAAPRSTRSATWRSGTSSSSRTSVARRPGPASRTSRSSASSRQRTSTPGLGLERLATILQGVDNLYEIDTTRVILDRASDLTGKPYGEQHRDDVSLRIVADHVRSSVMLIGDGITPGNEGRGYVLRRLLRRVIRNMRHARRANSPTMAELVDATIEAMGPQYPELITESSRIHEVALAEDGRSSRRCARDHAVRERGRTRCATRAALSCRASGRSSCTTPTASRSTSPSRWRRSRASPSTSRVPSVDG